jgi:uncharacterized membrane protein YccC
MRGTNLPAPAAPRPPAAAAPSRARLLAIGALTVWSRVVLAIVLSAVSVAAAGLNGVAGYAVIPGIYLALSPPAGRIRMRVGAITLATVLIAGLVVLGAELSRSTAAIAAGLAVVGFGTGLMTRVGPRAAAMSWPLLMGFAYSAGQPLGEASAASRGAAVLVALPAYVLAAGLVLAGDQRRPIVLGAASVLGAVARALGLVAAGSPGAAAELEGGLLRFRLATARLKDAALPLGRSADSRAALLLALSVQRCVTDAGLIALKAAPDPGGGAAGPRPDERVALLARSAAQLADALALRGAPPAVAPLDRLAAAAGADGGPDRPTAALAGSLADAVRAADVLQGRRRALPPGLLGELPGALARLRSALRVDDPVFRRAARLGTACAAAGLIAGLLGLGRAYWAVFAVVVVLNAPAALDRRRAVMRVAGTLGGLVLALVLVRLTGGDQVAGLVAGLLVLLVGVVFMPVNYAAAVLFITGAVGTLFSIGGDTEDFISYRLLDNAVGAGVVLLIGALVFHTRREYWWRTARATAGLLADAVASGAPGGYRDALVLQLVRLRAETAEAGALPGAPGVPAATWLYLAAAEDLVRKLTGPAAEPAGDPAALAGRLRALATGGDGPAGPAMGGGAGADEVTRMERALTLLGPP